MDNQTIDQLVSKRLEQSGILRNNELGIKGENVKKLNDKIRAFAKSVITDFVKADEEKANVERKMQEISPYMPMATRIKVYGDMPVLGDYIRTLELMQSPVGNTERTIKLVFMLVKILAEKITQKDILDLLTEVDKKNEKQKNKKAASGSDTAGSSAGGSVDA